MPRKPTGKPTGRPVGSGTLGLSDHDTHTRLTIRIPDELYTRLAAFAEGRSYTRGTPQLAGCVRALLEHALACPYKRQTENNPTAPRDETRQTENDTRSREDIVRQTGSVPPRHLDAGDLEDMPLTMRRPPNGEAPNTEAQSGSLATKVLEPARVPVPPHVMPGPAIAPPGHYFGTPCQAHRHVSHGSSPSGEPQNLRNPAGKCVMCEEEKKAARTKRQALVTEEK